VIVFLVTLTYANSFSGTFTYDDRPAVINNPTIRQLWPLGPILNPPAESGPGGRPLANFSFAVSYALSGLQTWGYHLVSVTVHALAALTLFGVMRRTLAQPLVHARFGPDAVVLAMFIASLWAVHPLQTQTVTYISQRTEAMMALFYLLTFYCFIRGTTARPRLWFPLAVGACFLGALSKETIATVPLLLLLYDRTFVAGSFVAALRARARFYIALASSWVLIAWLLIGVRDRGVGYGLGITWFDYALTQCQAVVQYLSLGLWPNPLVFDRGVFLLQSFAEAAPYALLLLTLLSTTVWLLWSRPAIGFIGAWFFVILTPTSSVIPVIQQPIAENRPYLPLAALIALLVLAFYTVMRRSIVVGLASVLLIAFAASTHLRNRDYRSEISIWADSAAKAPANARAHYNLGVALDFAGRRAEAIVAYEAAILTYPDYAMAHNNLGNALAENGQFALAFPHLTRAVQLKPDYEDAHYNLGNAYLNTQRPTAALPHYEIALRLNPDQPKTLKNLAIVCLRTDREADAIRYFERAIAVSPSSAELHNNLAIVLFQLGRIEEAISHCETALRLNPDYTGARENLANFLKARTERPSSHR
jgi:tetratricopeptide (TPR) repeat protein